MLKLTRKETETIVVDGPAVIHIDKINGSRVMVGIEAPKDVKVLRGELVGRGVEVREEVKAA